MSHGTFGDNLARFKEPKPQETKPSRKSPHLPQHEAGRMAREVMGTPDLADILASVAAEITEEPESAPVSLLEMAGDHPLATYARQVADSIVVVKKNWPRSCALTRIIALIH